MKFNINNQVKVKLTDLGRKILKDNRVRLLADFPSLRKGMRDHPLCKEDSDGWSKWQLWNLMETFGPHISMGFDPPFETEIDLEEAKWKTK